MIGSDGIRAILVADAPVAAIVATRVYPVKLPQNPTLPAITYTQYVGDRDRTTDGPSGLVRSVFQVDCWAVEPKPLEALTDAVRQALDGYSGTIGTETIQLATVEGPTDLYSDSAEVFGKSFDVTVWHAETP